MSPPGPGHRPRQRHRATKPLHSGRRHRPAADKLLASDPSDSERATAELLSYVAATRVKQDHLLREYAQAVARTLRTQ
ncbi:hypothetical protein [Streptomyces albus]|uniref:hypothetical protein n=1 Tax=Streptomyces albus TaxID=1888 RepID=UPI0033D29BE3